MYAKTPDKSLWVSNMHFASDNWAGAHPKVAENVVRRNEGYQSAYGTGELDRIVEARFREIFERDVEVFFVATGTAANSLALAAVNKPGGVVFCHNEAHIRIDECSAPEFFTQGGKLEPVHGPLGKMDPGKLEKAVETVAGGGLNAGQCMAVSITQATESGTVHSLDEISAISAIARKAAVPLHMDGARFANALHTLGCSPADMTWKRGIDILSFGATKNGCWCAEALVFFDPQMARDMPWLRKRSGHTFSKSRFIAAQFEAYFADGLWLQTAAHANAMAARLAEAIRKSNSMRLAWEPEINEVFFITSKERLLQMTEAGIHVHAWQPPAAETDLLSQGEVMARMVTSFATTEDDIAALSRLLA